MMFIITIWIWTKLFSLSVKFVGEQVGVLNDDLHILPHQYLFNDDEKLMVEQIDAP